MQRISGIFLIAASRGSFLWRHSFFESGKEWKTSRSRWPFERTGQFWQSGKRYLHRGYGIYKPGWQIPCQQKGKRHTGNQKQSRFSGSIYAFKQRCFLQRTVNHSVEQVNRHGADTQHRETAPKRKSHSSLPEPEAPLCRACSYPDKNICRKK